jgi:NTE family protein
MVVIVRDVVEADMIGKTSEMISRRRMFSLLGLPIGFGLAAAPTVLASSGAEAQTAGVELERGQQSDRQQHLQGRPNNPQAQFLERHSASRQRKVALALQGGGSHGAFTWGVLDRLLDDATIDIIGVTGTSAGAMNGAILVDGLVRGGPKEARAELRRYWEAVGAMPGFGSFFSGISGEEAAATPLEGIPAYVESTKKDLSPYDLSQSNDDPVRPLLTDLIDFDHLRSQEQIHLTVCATNARTARRRVFTNRNVSVDALLASACLPQLFRAVEIDGEPYWDGALTGNPALGPLLTKMPNCDLIIVRVDPVKRAEAPRTSRDIFNRTVEISHNSTFWLELGALAVVLRFVEERRSPFRRLRFHIIEASPIMEKFPMSSKLNNYPPLLEYLFNLGRQTADAWIAQNGEALGQRSTLDVQQLLPGSVWDNI